MKKIAAVAGLLVALGLGAGAFYWRRSQESAAMCRKDPISEYYFPERNRDEGYALVDLAAWTRTDFELRKTAAKMAGICHFGPMGFEIRHPQTGRVLATWSIVRGFRTLE